MVLVLLVPLLVVCAITWQTSGAEYLRENFARQAPRWSGLHLAVQRETAVVDRIVRERRRLIVGVAIGGVAGIAVLFALDLRDDFEQGNLLVLLTGCVLGAVVTQCASLFVESRRRAGVEGGVVREKGTALRDVLPRVVTFGALSAALSNLMLAALGLSFFASGAFEFTEYSGPFSPVAAIVSSVVLALCFPLYLVVASITSRRRQSAATSIDLAWDDAFFARLSLTAACIPLGILPAASLSVVSALTLSLRHPEYDQAIRNLVVISAVGYAVFVGYLLVIYLLKPQWHYLRTLWPDVAARGTVERAALRATKREAAARAYRGLPPVSEATSTPEKAPAASL